MQCIVLLLYCCYIVVVLLLYCCFLQFWVRENGHVHSRGSDAASCRRGWQTGLVQGNFGDEE